MQILTRPEDVGEWTLLEVNRLLCDAVGLENGTGPSDEICYGNGAER